MLVEWKIRAEGMDSIAFASAFFGKGNSLIVLSS